MPQNNSYSRIESVYEDLVRAVSFASIFRHSNNKEVLERFNNTVEANAFNIIQDALIAECILCLSRIHDPDDHRKNRASLGELFKTMDVNTIDYFAEKARQWPGDKERNYRKVRVWLKRSKQAYLRLKKEECYKVLKAYRTNKIAHSLIEIPVATQAQYKDVFALLDKTELIVKYTYLSITGSHFDSVDFWRAWNRYSELFWESTLHSKP